MYTDFYPNENLGDQPVANVAVTPGAENAWKSNQGGPGAGTDLPVGSYSQVRVTAVRTNFTIATHMVGTITTPGGQLVVGEGQTLTLNGPIDSSLYTFSPAPGMILLINADVE